MYMHSQVMSYIDMYMICLHDLIMGTKFALQVVHVIVTNNIM